MQKLETNDYGTLIVEKSWANTGIHIAKLAQGGYCHITGQPISKREDFIKAIPEGKEREEALYWFDRKDDPTFNVKRKRIVITPYGSFEFDDGTPITSASEIIENLPQGILQDAALRWWASEQEKEESYRKEKANIEPSVQKAVANLKTK